MARSGDIVGTSSFAVFICIMFFPGVVVSDTLPPVQIQVFGEHSGRNIVYHYNIINNSDKAFVAFDIGYAYDSEHDEDIYQLGKLPIGWSFGEEGEGGSEIVLGPNSTSEPSGWAAMVYGSGTVTLRWHIPKENKFKTPSIKPGESLEGFSVTVAVDDKNELVSPVSQQSKEAYFNGNFRIGFPPPVAPYYGKLEVIDKNPPALSLDVKPDILWPPNGQLETVNVAITARDDYDPQPAIRLESITANETLTSDDIAEAAIGEDDRAFKLRAKREGSGNGRTYTITYSATDAVGNSTRSTATVVVPHDQRGRN